MVRVRDEKAFEMKKEALLIAALELIMEKGYQKFSLNQLLLKINMSKGVFFHYYKSKGELLESVVRFSASEIVDKLKHISKDTSLSPIRKIEHLFQQSSSHSYKNLNDESIQFSVMYSDENRAFIDLVTEVVLEAFGKAIEDIVRQGVEENEFSVKYIRGTAIQIVNLTMGTNKYLSKYMGSEMTQDQSEILSEVLKTFNEAVSGLLGCGPLQDLYVGF